MCVVQVITIAHEVEFLAGRRRITVNRQGEWSVWTWTICSPSSDGRVHGLESSKVLILIRLESYHKDASLGGDKLRDGTSTERPFSPSTLTLGILALRNFDKIKVVFRIHLQQRQLHDVRVFRCDDPLCGHEWFGLVGCGSPGMLHIHIHATFMKISSFRHHKTKRYIQKMPAMKRCIKKLCRFCQGGIPQRADSKYVGSNEASSYQKLIVPL